MGESLSDFLAKSAPNKLAADSPVSGFFGMVRAGSLAAEANQH